MIFTNGKYQTIFHGRLNCESIFYFSISCSHCTGIFRIETKPNQIFCSSTNFPSSHLSHIAWLSQMWNTCAVSGPGARGSSDMSGTKKPLEGSCSQSCSQLTKVQPISGWIHLALVFSLLPLYNCTTRKKTGHCHVFTFQESHSTLGLVLGVFETCFLIYKSICMSVVQPKW